MQAVICNGVAITQDKSDQQILKISRGRTHVTSFNIFCYSFRKIVVQKSPKTLNHIPVSYTHLTLPTICSV